MDDLAAEPTPAIETETEAESAPAEPAPPPFRVVALIPDDGREPPSNASDRDGSAAWCAASAPWHPILLAMADDVPRFEDVALPAEPGPGEVRLVALGHLDRLPPGYRERAEAMGVPVVEAAEDRLATVRAILARSPGGDSGAAIGDDPLARDYLALGSAHWWFRDLTLAMGHVDTLSRPGLAREVLAGARAWRSGDEATASGRLRAAFELLTQARERMYPLDAYLVDLCLLDASTPAGSLAGVLATRSPVTLLAPGRAVEVLAEREPEQADAIREAISGGWLDLIGGAYAEVDEPFLPWSSIAWQFRHASEVYRRHLDDRNVETLARRRFGLYPQLPQVARRFGLRYAIFGALDSGRFPLVPESKRLWASPDGTSLEAIARTPIAADRPIEGARLAWRVGKAMKDDQSATIVLAHWPEPVAPWFVDLRRTFAYASVLARWVTVNDYFHLSDRPFEEVQPTPDDYASAYLAQSAARRDPSPIAARAAHARARAGLDALLATHALAAALAGIDDSPIEPESELALETGRIDEAAAEVARRLPEQAASLSGRILGGGSGGRPGFLVLNPTGVARRVAVHLPDADATLHPFGPLKVAQMTAEGTHAVVELAPFGYAWIPREADPGRPASTPGEAATVRGRTLANGSIEATLDPTTGGLRSIHAAGEETARLGQRLAVAGLVGPDGKPAEATVRDVAIETNYAGPALAEATTSGSLHDPLDDRRIAAFTQRFRIWAGRPTLEIRAELTAVDPAWLARIAAADPWAQYLACRWAWPDPQSTLRRTALLSPSETLADRPETPDAIDITSRQRRTALLFGGLAHHQRRGTRMLDTLLLAGSESARVFELGVAVDLEHPFGAAIDFTAPAPVIATDAGPPRSGPAGWLVQVDHKAVAILRLAFEPFADDGKGWGLVADLIETAGRPARCRLRAFRDPDHARQVDGHGEHVVDLPVEGDAALVDLTPHEIARVELTLERPTPMTTED